MVEDRDELLRPDPVEPAAEDDAADPGGDGARELPDEDVSPSAGAPEPPD